MNVIWIIIYLKSCVFYFFTWVRKWDTTNKIRIFKLKLCFKITKCCVSIWDFYLWICLELHILDFSAPEMCNLCKPSFQKDQNKHIEVAAYSFPKYFISWCLIFNLEQAWNWTAISMSISKTFHLWVYHILYVVLMNSDFESIVQLWVEGS